jgi:hypothetical protein
MGNTLLAYPDRSLDPATTLSGGSWSAGLPIANLKDRLLTKVARTADTLAASSQWVENLGQPRDVKVIAVMGHNLSLPGTVRVRAYSDVGLATLLYDTGVLSAWPLSFTADDVLVQPPNLILPLTTIVTAQFWKFELVDTANAAGYLQVGRAWLGPAWQPTLGIIYGDEIGYEPRSVVTESLGGVTWVDQRLPKRAGTITFPGLTGIEKRTAMIFQKTIGNSGEVLYLQDVTHAAEDMLLYAFPATVRQVNPIRSAYYNASEMPMGLIENL